MLSDFTLGPVIGQGATAVVHRAVHHRSGIRVALKALDATRGPNLRLVQAEIAAMARVEHTNLLRVLDHGLVTQSGSALPVGTAWMAVDYASGGTLEDWLPPDWATTREVLLDVLSALAHAHSRGLLHRDLKPANLLRCTAEDARPGLKIADFGLAWVMGSEQTARGGTPMYMAPEQNEREGQLGPWTDLYAIGNLLFHWTTGRLPFLRDTVEATLAAQRDATLPAIEPRFSVPSGLNLLITHLLQKEPERRPASAAWVAWALQRLPEPTLVKWVPVAEHAPPTVPPVRSLTHGLGLGLLPIRDFPVIGRAREQEQLWARMDPIQQGRAQVVVLSGPRGIGAARLCSWVVRRARETGSAGVFTLAGGRVKDLASGEVGDRARRWILDREEPAVLVVDPVMNIAAIDLITTLLLERPHTPVLLLGPGADPSFDWSRYASQDAFLHLELDRVAPNAVLSFAHDGLGLAYGLAADVALLADGFVGRALHLVKDWVEGEALVSTPSGLRLRDDRLPGWPPGETSRYRKLLQGDEPGRRALELFAELHAIGATDQWQRVLALFELEPPTERLAVLVEEGLAHADPLILEPGLLTYLQRRFERRRSADTQRIAMAVDMPLPARGLLLFRSGRQHEGVQLLTRWVAEGHQGMELQLTARRMWALGFPDAGPAARFIAHLTQVMGRARLDGPFTTLPDLEHLLAHVQPATDAQRQILHETATRLFWMANRLDRAAEHLEQLEGVPVKKNLMRGLILVDAGRDEEAIPLLLEAFEKGNAGQTCRAANALGRLAMHAEQPERALQWFEEMHAASKQPLIRLVALLNLAIARLDLGDAELALQLLERTRPMESHGKPALAGYISVGLALVGLMLGDRTLVHGHTERALTFLTSPEVEDAEILLRITKRIQPTLPVYADLKSRICELLEARVT